MKERLQARDSLGVPTYWSEQWFRETMFSLSLYFKFSCKGKLLSHVFYHKS